MKTKKIKEDLNRELDEATPNLNEKKVKSQKISLIDDATLAAHKKMDKLRWLTASILLVVFAVACVLVITTLVKFEEPKPKTEVTSYIVTGLMSEKVHIVTKNGKVVKSFALDDAAIGYMEYDDSVKDPEGMAASEYIYNLIVIMTNDTMKNEVDITLQAVNNSFEKAKEELKTIKNEIIKLNVAGIGDNVAIKINLETEAIQHAAYNSIINLKTFINDLDSQLDVILANDVKESADA